MTLPNKNLIKEWLYKADGDFEAAIKLFKSKSKKKLYYVIAFHCQQAIEKYLKALLLCHKIDFPKIHDLLQLLKLLINKDTLLIAIKNDLQKLNPFAVSFRYPGEDITLEELKEALIITKRLNKLLLKRIKEFL